MTTQDTAEEVENEPEPNSQLSEYGKLMRARMEVADKYADKILPPAFAKWFKSKTQELLERDWNYFGAVDSLVVNANIPFVNDIGKAAIAQGLLTDEERLRCREVSG